MGRGYTGSLLNNNTFGIPSGIAAVTQRNLGPSPYISNALGQKEFERRMQSENVNPIRDSQGNIISLVPSSPGYIGGGQGGDQFTMDNINLFTPPPMDVATPEISDPIDNGSEEPIVGASGIDTSQETFMQQNQAEYPYVDTPEEPKPYVATPEEQKATKDKLFKLGDIFDNKEALGKIALGVALLEGTPIDDAFAMYKEFGSGEDADFELYDNVLGEVIDIGASDNINFRQKVKANPSRYSVNPVGTSFALKSGREEAIVAANIERDNKQWQKNYGDPAASARASLKDARKLEQILNSGAFKSGKFTKLQMSLREAYVAITGNEDETLNQQLMFETIVSKLIPNVRPEGAGATSDFEIDLYTRAIAGLERPETVNKRLVEDMIAASELAIKRAEYTDRALREGGGLSEADREFSEVMDILYYDKEYNPNSLEKNQLEIIKDIYGGKIPIPRRRLVGLKTYLEEQARTNSESEFVLLTY